MTVVDTREHEPYEIVRGQDAVLECRVMSHETVRLNSDAATGATTLNINPLDYALASGDKLLFGESTVVTLSGVAAAGVVAVPVTALAGPLRSGDLGQKIRDLTSFMIEYELLAQRGDATPLIAPADVTVSILTQTGDDRGKVQVSIPAAKTLANILDAGSLFDAYWKTDAGSKRPLAYGTVKAVEAGSL